MIGIGGIIGDICGKPYTYNNVKGENFDIFEKAKGIGDKSILIWAQMFWIINGGNLEDTLRYFVGKYPRYGYSSQFFRWATGGSNKKNNNLDCCDVIRAIPSMFCNKNSYLIERDVKKVIETVNTNEKVINAGKAFANAMFFARIGIKKENIKNQIEKEFKYNLHKKLDEIKGSHLFSSSVEDVVPEALNCFFESENFESAIHNAIYVGGDSGSIATLAGAMAEVYYGLSLRTIDNALVHIPEELKELLNKFTLKIC